MMTLIFEVMFASLAYTATVCRPMMMMMIMIIIIIIIIMMMIIIIIIMWLREEL